MLMKSLMGYHADVTRGGLWLDPALPESYGDRHITVAPIAHGRITIGISGSGAAIKGPPEGMPFRHGTRPRAVDPVEPARLRDEA